MNSSSSRNEGWLYALAFLIAFGLRFVQLGAAPLTDSEATLALQAWQLAQGQSVVLAPHSAYLLFTSVLFKVIADSNFMARLLPALAGSLLVFVPLLFKGKLGSRAAWLLGLLLAIDPGLNALSRQADGTMLAVTFLLLAWGLWLNRRTSAAGIFLALALLSGPSVWSGLLVLTLTAIFLRGLQPTLPAADSAEMPAPPTSNLLADLRKMAPAFGLTLLLAGTLFITVPNGLSAALAALPAYLTGWVSPSGFTPARMLFTFLAYEPLGIVLASLALYRGLRTNSKRLIRLMMGLGVALLLGIFYRDPHQLVWAIIPLLALAAMELARALDLYRDELVEVGVVGAAILLLLVYSWFNLAGIALNPAPVPMNVPLFGLVENPRLFVLYGSLGIIAVSVGLVAFGWSMRTARLGLTWAFTFFLTFYSLGAAWGASGLRNPGGTELWSVDSRPQQADLLSASVDDLSEFSLGHIDAQPVTLSGLDSPALEWLLRKNGVTSVTVLDPQAAPPLVVTLAGVNDPGLPSAYRGQDFTWRQPPLWDQAQTYDWVNWLVFRKLPSQPETVILWARNDLFPDGRTTP